MSIIDGITFISAVMLMEFDIRLSEMVSDVLIKYLKGEGYDGNKALQ
jgi:hypothetical protein